MTAIGTVTATLAARICPARSSTQARSSSLLSMRCRTVAVMACDDEILPSQERIQSVGDDAELREVYDTERQLLYVACTRKRSSACNERGTCLGVS